MITFLAWFTVIGIPLLVMLALAWWIYHHVTRDVTDDDDAPKPLHDLRYTYNTTINNVPKWTSIDEESFLRDDMTTSNDRIVEAGTRVWRIYRSVDRIQWVECDPALTERAAANYADYIKRSNPEEFVRCDDPNGVILFYE